MANKKLNMKIDWTFKETTGYPSMIGIAKVSVKTQDGQSFNKEMSQKGTSEVDCVRTLSRVSHFQDLIKMLAVVAIDDVPEKFVDKPKKTRKKSNAKNN
tara:strand:- start:1709 stop:2005 length:297 start_codon:yes stop_codon:yes gene_type:complete